MDVIPVDDGSARLDDILELHRRHRATLGFLPAQAFYDRATAGTLLAAVCEDATVGYALYDLPRDEIALRHLCVATSHRGRGIASQLVDEVAHRHPERRGIRVRCRRDWAANLMWPRLEFEPLADAPGRSAARHLLTTWWRDFGHPTLFSVSHLAGPRVVAVLDTNVVLDLATRRPWSEESQGLLSDWVDERARLAVTKAVTQELNNHPDAATRAHTRDFLNAFSRVDTAKSAWGGYEQALREGLGATALSPHDQADLQHIARAHGAGAQYFITRDEATLRIVGGVAESVLGIEVTSPGAFLQALWELGEHHYEPARLENTAFRVMSVSAGDIDGLARRFLNHGEGERLGTFRQQLRRLLAAPMRWQVRVVKHDESAPVALFGRSLTERREVPLLRATGPLAATVARQVLYLQRHNTARFSASVLRVTDPMVSPAVFRALHDESFVLTSTGWWGAAIRTSAAAVETADTLKGLDADPTLGTGEAAVALLHDPVPAVVDAVEARFWPLKVLGTRLPTFLVPIRPAFAAQLFDTRLSQGTLFARDDSLGLSREHVYYRAAKPNVLLAPARILWYVTREPDVPGTGAVRACSRLAEVVVAPPRTLHRRFKHLGVYGLRDVQAVARDGEAMAIRFTHTEGLRPVPLPELREAAAQANGGGVLLQSPWRVSEHVFESVYHRGQIDHP